MKAPRVSEKVALIPFEPHRTVGHVVDDSTGCWMWHGCTGVQGYGRISLHGRGKAPTTAHRAYYERVHGPIACGLALDHLCRNRRCVNPAHMEPVTFGENLRRGSVAKLTPELVRQMRAEYAAGGVTQKGLARKYGLAKKSGWHILRGVKWRDVQ